MDTTTLAQKVEHVTLPGTELTPSRIGLGTWAIGGWMWGGTDEVASIRAIHAAIDQGITLIDTAPVYGFGMSESIVGKALADGGRRQRVVLATKVGLEWHDGQIRRNGSRARILAEVEDSRRRLRTDVLDLYQVHWPDPATPIEETAVTLAELFHRGVIRAIGVSNFSPEQMDRFRAVSPLHTDQPPYNLFERAIEADVLPYCQARGIGVIAYGALCRGLLSGRIRPGAGFSGDDLRRVDPKFQPGVLERYVRAVDRLDSLARARFGKRVIALAVRWLLDRPGVSVALWGARRPDQLDAAHEVFGWKLDAATLADIDAILEEEIPQEIGPEFMAPPEAAP
jgi:aryl-alcohol dehydrogenase-like predicted oxidoreductase